MRNHTRWHAGAGGPWHRPHQIDDKAKDCIIDQDGNMIGEMYHFTGTHNEIDLPVEDYARLAAAAPEMLAALEAVVRENGLHGQVTDAMRDVRAAIKKAKGNESA